MNRVGYCAALACLVVSVTGRLATGDQTNGIQLKLVGVTERVLANNPDVKAARLEWSVRRSAESASYGAFEPALVVGYEKTDTSRTNDSLERISQRAAEYYEKDEEYKAGIEGRFITGATYDLGYSVKNMANSLNTNDYGRFVHEWETFVGIKATQPLLKGAGIDAAMAEVNVAKAESTAAFHNYRKQLMVILSRAESAYWNLSFAQEQHRMAVESVGIAEKLVVDSKERVKTGKMSELDLLQTESGLAARLSQQAESKQALLDAMMQLKLLVSDRGVGGHETVQVVDALLSPEDEMRSIDKEREWSLEWARNAQPELMLRYAGLQREEISVAYAKNQRWPQLDLKGSYGFNGLGEDAAESWQMAGKQDYPAWAIGVELRIPMWLGIRERGQLAAAKTKKEAALEQLRAVDYEIVNSVHMLLRRIGGFKEQITSARKVVDYRKRLLEAELTRLEEGKSNTRKVYDLEDELSAAQKSALETIVRCREALMQLAFVRGSILRDRGLEEMKDGRILLAETVDPEGWSQDVPPIDRGGVDVSWAGSVRTASTEEAPATVEAPRRSWMEWFKVVRTASTNETPSTQESPRSSEPADSGRPGGGKTVEPAPPTETPAAAEPSKGSWLDWFKIIRR